MSLSLHGLLVHSHCGSSVHPHVRHKLEVQEGARPASFRHGAGIPCRSSGLQAIPPGYPYPVSTTLLPADIFIAAATVRSHTKKTIAEALFRLFLLACSDRPSFGVSLTIPAVTCKVAKLHCVILQSSAQLCQSQSITLSHHPWSSCLLHR